MRITDDIIANDLPYILFYWFVKDAKRRNLASILLLELFNQDEVKCLPLLKLDFVEFEAKHHLAHADNKKLLSWLKKRLSNFDAQHNESAEKRIEFKQMILTMVHALLKKLNQTDDLNAISEEDQAALAELVKKLKLNETPWTENTGASFKAVPGKVHHIFLEHESGQVSIAQQGQKQYKFLVTDQFGNKVVNGTNVYVDGEDLIINEEKFDQTVLTTKKGAVSFSVQGVNHAGAHTLTLTAGEAQCNASIIIDDIELSITPLSDVFVGSTVEVEITATGDVENLPVMLSAHRGVLEEDLVVIKDGRATTTMYVGEIPGSGYLFARVANDVVNQSFNVVNRSNAFLLNTVLVKGSNKGQYTFDNKVYEYTNATQAWIGGVPGESISLDLFSLVDPAIDPLLSYGFTCDYIDNTFLDLQEDTPAHFSSVNIVRTPAQITTRQAAQLEKHSYIAVNRITKHERLNNIGFVAELKAIKAGTLINYGNQLTLSLLSNGRLVATANTASGTMQVETTKPYKNKWIKLGVHIREGKLQLAINDDLYEIEAAEPLNPLTASRLLSIGDSTAPTQEFQIASLKLIDWLGVPTLEIVGGQTAHTIGQDGYAKVDLQVPAAYVALSQQREQEKLYQHYAQDLIEDGVGVSSGWSMFSFLGKFYFDKTTEKVTIKVQNAKDNFNLTVALINEKTFEYTAAALAYEEDATLVAKGCAKGALMGSSDNGTIMTDVITSFFVIGDIRDLGSQGWYWFVDNEENFSPMAATFGGLGLVSTALAATGAGAPVAVSLKDAFNTAKVIPKNLKDAKFLEPLGHYLQKNILDVKDYEKAAQAAVKVMPLVQVLTFAAVDQEAQSLRELVSEGITSPADLETWIEFASMFSEHVDGEEAASNATTQQQ